MSTATMTTPITVSPEDARLRLDPTEDETLALFTAAMANHGGPMEKGRFLSIVESGHPCGAAHIGAIRHRQNMNRLIEGERVIVVAKSRAGFNLYAPAMEAGN
jgi:hypothetical protein